MKKRVLLAVSLLAVMMILIEKTMVVRIRYLEGSFGITCSIDVAAPTSIGMSAAFVLIFQTRTKISVSRIAAAPLTIYPVITESENVMFI